MTSIYVNGQYLADNPDWHETDGPYKAGFVMQMVRKHLPDVGVIADVGCGSGKVAEIVAAALPQANVHGFDISPDAAMLWPRRRGDNLAFTRGDYLQLDDRFDPALCLDVFEHVEDYFGFLRNLRARSDHVIFNVPLDMSAAKVLTKGIRRARVGVGHLHYFNEYTARATISDCGYTIVDSFLTTPLEAMLPRNKHEWRAVLPRVALRPLGKKTVAALVGGYSLAVLART